MDTSVPDITFDADGICNYCTDFLNRVGHIVRQKPETRKAELDTLIRKVKASGAGKPYDCVVGVSGGIDSSWVLVKAVELGLRPLAAHMDNGWNTELAQNNIANLVRTLGVDLYTHVIDWDEYRRLMQAFFDADVVDVELLYDNAMLAVNYQQAAKYGTGFILAGTNAATEGMRMPREWNWLKHDKKHIKALARRFGNVPIRTFPSIGTMDFIIYEFIRRVRWISFLDLVDYNKFHALDVLQRDFGYKPYAYKHYESIFTRFYQGYLLPKKFAADKRRVHLGTLVASGQMTRDQALEALKTEPYPSEKDLVADRRYFIKKMGWTIEQLDDYVNRPGKPHLAYPSERPLWEFLSRMYKRWAASRL
jgi:N-acetyl sugar amidotransferase